MQSVLLEIRADMSYLVVDIQGIYRHAKDIRVNGPS